MQTVSMIAFTKYSHCTRWNMLNWGTASKALTAVLQTRMYNFHNSALETKSLEKCWRLWAGGEYVSTFLTGIQAVDLIPRNLPLFSLGKPFTDFLKSMNSLGQWSSLSTPQGLEQLRLTLDCRGEWQLPWKLANYVSQTGKKNTFKQELLVLCIEGSSTKTPASLNTYMSLIYWSCLQPVDSSEVSKKTFRSQAQSLHAPVEELPVSGSPDHTPKDAQMYRIDDMENVFVPKTALPHIASGFHSYSQLKAGPQKSVVPPHCCVWPIFSLPSFSLSVGPAILTL